VSYFRTHHVYELGVSLERLTTTIEEFDAGGAIALTMVVEVERFGEGHEPALVVASDYDDGEPEQFAPLSREASLRLAAAIPEAWSVFDRALEKGTL
jgi:hypothetical protein